MGQRENQFSRNKKITALNAGTSEKSCDARSRL